MKINWRIRLQSKEFWLALLSQVVVLITVILNVFDIQVDLLDLQNKLAAVVVAVFGLLALFYGVVNDPTTPGISDSDRALNRENLGED